MIGVNLAGAEFGSGRGQFGREYTYPTASDLDYFAESGVELVRLPFKWERVQASLGGELDGAELSRIATFLDQAHERGIRVVLDLHNYGRYDGAVIGSSEVPTSAFADLWGKLATALAGHPAIEGFGLMNEPHDMGGAAVWPAAAQAAVDAIRAAGATETIIVAGDAWSGAQHWPEVNAQLRIDDPLSRLLFEAHVYFDRDNSGTYRGTYDEEGAYPDVAVDRVQPFLDWLRANDYRGFVGEYAVPNDDPRWLEALDRFVAYLEANGVSSTYWAGGPWWGDDQLTVQPFDGEVRPQWEVLTARIGDLRMQGGTGNADYMTADGGLDAASRQVGGGALYGFAGDDTLRGGGARDVLSGGRGADHLLAGGGNDQLFGGDGFDILIGDAGDDQLYGQIGDDVLVGATGDDWLSGSDGADRLAGGNGADRMFGGDGADRLNGQDEGDRLEGGDGDDLLLGQGGGDLILSGEGADLVDGGVGNDTVGGQNGHDRIGGGAGDDHLYGDAGNDTLRGSDGADRLFGQIGDDVMRGELDRDSLEGGDGADTLAGGAGHDELKGGAGNDRLLGEEGDDHLAGEDGEDIVSGGSGRDTIGGGAGVDLLDGGDHDDRIFGEDGGDGLYGGAGNDLVAGAAGDDGLLGGLGDDTLEGGDGSDVLIGGIGLDELWGGGGRDVFVFQPASGRDVVRDFDGAAGDRLSLPGQHHTLSETADGLLIRSGGSEVLLVGMTADAFDAAFLL